MMLLKWSKIVERLKYIVLDTAMAGPTIVVFPAWLTHKDFAVMGKIISAGFVGRNDATKSGFYTYGESISLKLQSRPEDQGLLDMSWASSLWT